MRIRGVHFILMIATFIYILTACEKNPTDQDIAQIKEKILSIEQEALNRWYKGDPTGFLEIYSNDISYFSPGHSSRIDSLIEMSKLLIPIEGKIHIDRDLMVNPRVQLYDNTAILTYNLFNFINNNETMDTSYWSSTSVYVKTAEEWKMVHSHWSHPNKKLESLLDI